MSDVSACLAGIRVRVTTGQRFTLPSRIRLIICHSHGLTLGAHRHSQKNRLTVSVRSDHIWDAAPFADVAMLLQQFALAICCWSRLSFEFCNRRRYHDGRENVALGDVHDE